MAGRYVAYHQRSADTMRESDRALLALMANGSLPRHLRQATPGIDHWSVDTPPEVIAQCDASPGLVGIRFDVMSVPDLPSEPKFHVNDFADA